LFLAIKEFEGWYPGSLSYRNFNPCNLRTDGDLGRYAGFAKFSSYENGVKRCMRSIDWYASQGSTIADMMYAWAPESDGNNPSAYVQHITDKTGITASTKISDLI